MADVKIMQGIMDAIVDDYHKDVLPGLIPFYVRQLAKNYNRHRRDGLDFKIVDDGRRIKVKNKQMGLG